MWFLHFVVKKPAATATLNHRIEVSPKTCRCRDEGIMPRLCEMISYLQETYTADNVFAEVDSNDLQFTQTSIGWNWSRLKPYRIRLSAAITFMMNIPLRVNSLGCYKDRFDTACPQTAVWEDWYSPWSRPLCDIYDQLVVWITFFEHFTHHKEGENPGRNHKWSGSSWKSTEIGYFKVDWTTTSPTQFLPTPPALGMALQWPNSNAGEPLALVTMVSNTPYVSWALTRQIRHPVAVRYCGNFVGCS